MRQVLRSRRLAGKLLDFSPGRKSQYEIYAKVTKRGFSQSKVRKEERTKEKGMHYKTFRNPFFLDVKSVYHANKIIP